MKSLLLFCKKTHSHDVIFQFQGGGTQNSPGHPPPPPVRVHRTYFNTSVTDCTNYSPVDGIVAGAAVAGVAAGATVVAAAGVAAAAAVVVVATTADGSSQLHAASSLWSVAQL